MGLILQWAGVFIPVHLLYRVVVVEKEHFGGHGWTGLAFHGVPGGHEFGKTDCCKYGSCIL